MTTLPILHRNCAATPWVHEALINVCWYAESGSYKIEIIGYGASESDATASAMRLISKASDALTSAGALG
jgi:hypothetical protein